MTILYDSTVIDFDDRTLTHLQIVIVNKFAKHEAFLMSWRDDRSTGGGRSSAWLAPTIPLFFKFLGGRVPDVNTEWLLTLGKSAESSTGLIVTEGELLPARDSDRKYPGDIKRGHRVR